ncbi:hypothetical protein [Citrobacter portucalensis]|uniref:hypothetical protein n=1 Tax=Citrobacter portucalensis TaxID=1639133 RepID=UPI003CEA15F1
MSKYLIIEDEQNKADVIKAELLNFGIHETSINHVKSIKRGLECLRSTKYRLVILDLNIPAKDDETPKENGGVIFLGKLIRDKNRYIRPNQIIALTAYPKLIFLYEKNFRSWISH